MEHYHATPCTVRLPRSPYAEIDDDICVKCGSRMEYIGDDEYVCNSCESFGEE